MEEDAPSNMDLWHRLGRVIAYLSLRLLAELLRPEFQPSPLRFEGLSPDRLTSILALVLLLIVVFAIHELIHALFLWLFTGHLPILVVAGGGLAVRLPSWYIPRDQFLVTNLAPLWLMTFAGLLLVNIVPPKQISLLLFLTAMNMAGSIADLVSSAYLFLHPPSTYIETGAMEIYAHGPTDPNPVPAWKLRLRSFVENEIARLDPTSGSG